MHVPPPLRAAHAVLGECDECWTDTAVVGSWQDVVDALHATMGAIPARPPMGARVEGGFDRWDVLAVQ